MIGKVSAARKSFFMKESNAERFCDERIAMPIISQKKNLQYVWSPAAAHPTRARAAKNSPRRRDRRQGDNPT
jgi:hypothetical protein